MKRNPNRNAFTLVELLTVVVIIGIIAGLSMVALSGSYRTAKEAKTRATIQKLDTAILQIFEQYEDRYNGLQIDRKLLGSAITNLPPLSSRDAYDWEVEMTRLHFVRDLMRMEMPFLWEEISYIGSATNLNMLFTGDPIPIQATFSSPYGYSVGMSPVMHYYRHALKSVTLTTNTGAPPSAVDFVTVFPKTINSEAQSAELLYLIIANLNPEALEGFHGSEIGDADDNGLNEFLDAWGRPIRFIRFAPAFTGSDLQPDVVAATGIPLEADAQNLDHWVSPHVFTTEAWQDPENKLTGTNQALALAMTAASRNYHDPMDPSGWTRSWFLYPLIVSAGHDGQVDLNFAYKQARLPKFSMVGLMPDPAVSSNILSTCGNAFGMPEDTSGDGVLNHLDNIHNHRITRGF